MTVRRSMKVRMMAGLAAAVFAAPVYAGEECASSCAKGKDVVATAIEAGSFKTLTAAVDAAGLTETLKGKGPFTVFAPTDEAFAKLPKGTVEGLLKDLPKLRSVLKYHVVAGQVGSADVVKLTSAKTVLGQTVGISTSGGVKVGNAKVVKTDIACSNGVIHVIDAVLLPKADIVDVAREAGAFKTLLAAADAAGLTDTLRSEGPFTLFAPSDEAFAKLPKGTVDGLLKDLPKLRAILRYHVVPGRVMAADAVKLTSARTALGQSFAISTTEGVRVDGAKVVKTDIAAANGVIHVIDSVILPKDDIIDVARKAGSFKTLLTAVDAAGLQDDLRSGSLTLFAPSDEAFAKLPAGTVESLLKDPAKLKAILTYHVVSGKVSAEDASKVDSAKTLQGGKLSIQSTDGIMVDSAKVVRPDIQAANGVIHVIDAVLIPS